MTQEYPAPKGGEELVDIRDVKLDSSMGQAERVKSFLKQIKNPYCFRVGDVVVNVAYTGTNFERPKFQKMMEAVRAGEINCIIVKDLSRFGRDYIDAGR